MGWYFALGLINSPQEGLVLVLKFVMALLRNVFLKVMTLHYHNFILNHSNYYHFHLVAMVVAITVLNTAAYQTHFLKRIGIIPPASQTLRNDKCSIK